MFNYIDVNVFRENMTKYPNGLSIFEALSTVITSFNSYVSEINSKVAEGILETDAARTALSAELNDLFGVLREEYQSDFQGLQAEVDAAVDTINDKVSQEQLAVFSAQLGEIEQGQLSPDTAINFLPTGASDEYVFNESTNKYEKKVVVKHHVMTDANIDSLITTFVNFDIVRLPRTALPGIFTQLQGVTPANHMLFGFKPSPNLTPQDNVSEIGNYFDTASYSSRIFLIVAKGTFADLTAARDFYRGKSIYYKLQTPTVQALPETLSESSEELVRLSSKVSETNAEKWTGKLFVTFGDSITAQDAKAYGAGHVQEGQIAKGYQTLMRKKMTCVVQNQGASARDMPLIWANGISSYPFTGANNMVDYVSITFGANDHR